MDWFGVFAAGLASSFFWPFIGLTLLSAALLVWGQVQKDKHSYGTAQHTTAIVVQHGALQSLAIMWLVWGVLNAVPEPNYTEKKVEVVKIKKASTMDTLVEAYDKCIYSIADRDYCKELAEKTASGTLAPKNYIKTIYKLSPKDVRYKNIYGACMAQAKANYINDEELVAAIIKTCSNDAKQVIALQEK